MDEDEPVVEVSRHEELLNKRRLTVLSSSEEKLVQDDQEDEDIIEGIWIDYHKKNCHETKILFSGDGNRAHGRRR